MTSSGFPWTCGTGKNPAYKPVMSKRNPVVSGRAACCPQVQEALSNGKSDVYCGPRSRPGELWRAHDIAAFAQRMFNICGSTFSQFLFVHHRESFGKVDAALLHTTDLFFFFFFFFFSKGHLAMLTQTTRDRVLGYTVSCMNRTLEAL